MRQPDFYIDELIDSLQGSCDTIENRLPEGMLEEDLTAEELATLDSRIFLCACCGWWCSSDECNDTDNGVDQLCNDCIEEEGDDE